MGTADMSEHQQDTPRPDLTQTAAVVADVVRGVSDEDLGRPTPCPGTSVAAMLDHVAGLTMAFTAAATSRPPPIHPGSTRLSASRSPRH
jgi:hypothetical protein